MLRYQEDILLMSNSDAVREDTIKQTNKQLQRVWIQGENWTCQLFPRGRTRTCLKIIPCQVLGQSLIHLFGTFSELLQRRPCYVGTSVHCLHYTVVYTVRKLHCSSARMFPAVICPGSIIAYWILEMFIGLQVQEDHKILHKTTKFLRKSGFWNWCHDWKNFGIASLGWAAYFVWG